MKKLFVLLLLLIGICVFAQDKYGRKIELKEKTKVSDILKNPTRFEGKTVLIQGEVADVCAMAGCWMEIKSDKADQKIKIKVKDGDIVFPVEAKGKTALVEGKVYKIELTKEEALEYYEHLAMEQGTDFDPKTVTGPVTIYQIKGIGAEIN
jgi:co-chaperonin GroES (HSP10)